MTNPLMTISHYECPWCKAKLSEAEALLANVANMCPACGNPLSSDVPLVPDVKESLLSEDVMDAMKTDPNVVEHPVYHQPVRYVCPHCNSKLVEPELDLVKSIGMCPVCGVELQFPDRPMSAGVEVPEEENPDPTASVRYREGN